MQQAQRLVTYFMPQVTAAAGDSDVLVIGDLNAYGFEDPINYLTSTGGLVNEIERFVRPRGLAVLVRVRLPKAATSTMRWPAPRSTARWRT